MITRQAFRANANLVADGFLIKQLFGAGLTWLEQNQEKVNRMNVFPVPDGDTGTNMYLTMRSAYKAVANLEEAHVGRLSQAVANGALEGARGNSGVILSQILRGTAVALEGQEKLTAPLLVEACRSAVDYAYNAVEKPVEGTILTVSRGMMEAVVRNYEKDQDLIILLKRMVTAGRAALRRTPDMLPMLKKAGVVDSGGQGLVFIFEGMLRALCGKALSSELDVSETAVAVQPSETWQDALVPDDELGYGYDVQFLMRGATMNINEVRTAIQNMGWSTLVVGDDKLIKVHVHVHNPGEPLSYAINYGAAIDDIVVENMQLQYEGYVQERALRERPIRTDIPGVAVVTVAAGDGLERIFADQFNAAAVIRGGQTMNPSTGDFLNAIRGLPNDDIILLPNNKNVLLSAQQAAKQETGKRVAVVPSFSIPQGIAAMFEYINLCADGNCTLDEVEAAMKASLLNVVTCEITNANRDAEFDGVQAKVGQYIGLINDVLVAAADRVNDVCRETLLKAKASAFERITLYFGRDANEEAATALVSELKDVFPKQEFEIVEGGQALYPYLISLE